MRGLITLVVVGLILVLLVGWALVTFNRLVRQRNQVEAADAQIDVQLKRRHDLIPNLVQVVQGYAGHERDTLDAVVRARSAAIAANGSGPAQRAGAEGQLSVVLGRLLAVTEAYPGLKANANFLALQSELAGTENKLAYARQFFNNAVQTLNTTIQSVPSNLIAALGRFRTAEYFEVTGAERQSSAIRF